MEKNVESSEATFGILMDVMGAPGSGESSDFVKVSWSKSGKLMGQGPFGMCDDVFQ